MNDALFSHKSDNWGTPQYIIDKAQEWVGHKFTLDVCADYTNKKCDNYYGLREHEFIDGLTSDWGGHNCWMNPPYSKITSWINKAIEETLKDETTKVTCLLPARTDTKWFHDRMRLYADEINFLKGRIIFEGGNYSAPFPSMIVIFSMANIFENIEPMVNFLDWRENDTKILQR